jgi:hypothetical protein
MKNMIRTIRAIPILLALGFAAVSPDVPDNLKAPAGESVILATHAKGVQIYVCQASGQKAEWTLKAPEAELTDETGKIIIHHSAGPSWKHADGSEITGKVIAKHDAPNNGAIPWLLLSAASHTGQGIMSRVTTIQRIHTEGGMPPDASKCSASANGQESRSPYSADYYFYAAADSSR